MGESAPDATDRAAGGRGADMTGDRGAGPVGIGIIGAGVISAEYLDNLTRFPDVRVVAVGDLRPDAARARAAEYGIAGAGAPDVVLADRDVEIVVNLTVPEAHADVAAAALEAGKHVWNEKPLALDPESGRRLVDLAADCGRRLACAPDTFLGAGLQAARRLVDEGAIGRPLTALALMQSPGPDAWHPNPAFLFQDGAGPLFDIGPYYLTALVQLLGPVASVSSVRSTARAIRQIGSGPLAGQPFDVTAPTHVAALLAFAGGESAQLLVSFDSSVSRIALELNGVDGTLVLPDPNRFDGEIAIHRRGGGAEPETLVGTSAASTRGTGVLDLARAIREARPHRADGRLALHVLELMTAISTAAETRGVVDVTSTVERASLLPSDWDPHAATLVR